MRGSVWHIINCPNGLPRLFFCWSWRYQNRFRTYNQRVGNCPANSKSPLTVRPNSNTNQVGSPVYNVARLSDTPYLHGTLHRSSRIRHNMPLVHLWVRVEQLIVGVIHQTKLKRCWSEFLSLSLIASHNFFVVHQRGITFTFLLYSIGTKKQPVVDTL